MNQIHTSARSRITSICVLAVALVIPFLITGHADALTYTVSQCGSGDICISDGTSFSTSSTASSGCTMAGWDLLTSETGITINFYNYSYGGSGCSSYTTVNNADQVRNRMSASGRTACYYNEPNLVAPVFALPYNSTTWNTLASAYRNQTSSITAVVAGASC